MNTKVLFTTVPKDNPFADGKPWDADAMGQCLKETGPFFDALDEAVEDSTASGYGPEVTRGYKITIEEVAIDGGPALVE